MSELVPPPWPAAESLNLGQTFRSSLRSRYLQNVFFRRYYSDCKEKQAARQARSEEDAKKLWEISEKLVGLKSD